VKNTPAWLKNTATFGCWPGSGRTITEAQRGKCKDVPLLMNVQHEKAVREAHRMGARALSYLSFYDTFVHTDGFEGETERVPWDPKYPQILLLDKENRFVNTPMDGSWRMWRYLACNNTKEYTDRALAMVHEKMRWGADGIFVDNADHREPCYGHGVPVGYSTQYRMVCTAMPAGGEESGERLSETNPHHGRQRSVQVWDPAMKVLPRHRHLYPDHDHDYAFVKLLEKVRKVIRSYGRDKVMLVNGATFAEHADGGMIESFIFSWAWKGRFHTWPQIKQGAKRWEPYLRSGGTIQALTYLGRTDQSVDQDAVYAYAAAQLCGYMWSDYQTGQGPLCRQLRSLNLGRALTPMLGGNEGVNYRMFERGIAAVNDSPRARSLNVQLPRGQKEKAFHDLYGKYRVEAANGRIKPTVPALAGAVFCTLSS
jgi:hypothetical protein